MVAELRRLTDRPWGVDLICAETGMGPACTDAHVDACVELGVPLVVFHHDPPPRRWTQRLTDAGIPVWMQVSSPELADAAARLGVVGLVAQGVEAGGHNRGTTPLSSLLPRLRERFPDQLLLAAGGIADGAGVADALRAGADGVWVGTRLVASAEAFPPPSTSGAWSRRRGRPLSPLRSDPSGPTPSIGFSRAAPPVNGPGGSTRSPTRQGLSEFPCKHG